MRTLPFRAAPLVLAAVLLAGCGGGDDPAPAADGGGGVAGAPAGDGDSGAGKAGDCNALVGMTFCMHYELTGAVTAKGVLAGTGTDGNGGELTCASWAKGAPGGDDGQPHLYLPQGGPYQQGDKFGGLTGDIIEHYHGPGTYEKKDLSGQGSPSGVITPSSQTGFVLVGASTGTATIAADGSGSIELIDMGTGQYGHPETLSAKVSWTCHDG